MSCVSVLSDGVADSVTYDSVDADILDTVDLSSLLLLLLLLLIPCIIISVSASSTRNPLHCSLLANNRSQQSASTENHLQWRQEHAGTSAEHCGNAAHIS